MATRHVKPQPRDRAAFDVLLSANTIDDDQAPAGEGSEAQWIPLDKIITRPQPRRYFDEAKLKDLASSFTSQGFKGAINVRPTGEGTYELIAGERRYRAAGIAGLDKVRCFIDDYTDEEALRFALAENLLREDLSKLEEIEGILELIELEHNIPREQVVKLVQSEGHHRKQSGGNVSPSEDFLKIQQILTYFGIKVETFRTKYLKGLNLPTDVKKAHMEGNLAFNAALELGKIKDEIARRSLMKEAMTDNLSFRDIQAKTQEIVSSSPPKASKKDSPIEGVGEALKRLKKATGKGDLSAPQVKKIQKIQALIEGLIEELTD